MKMATPAGNLSVKERQFLSALETRVNADRSDRKRELGKKQIKVQAYTWYFIFVTVSQLPSL